MTSRGNYPPRVSYEHVDGVLEAVSASGDVALYRAEDHYAHHRQDGRHVNYLTVSGADSRVLFHADRPSGEWQRTGED
jgi:hypothetical protein